MGVGAAGSVVGQIALVRHLRRHETPLLQPTRSLCSAILRWRIQTTISLILVLDLNVFREILLDLTIDLGQILVRQSIRRFVLFGLHRVPLEHGLEPFDAVDDFLFSVPLLGDLSVVEE